MNCIEYYKQIGVDITPLSIDERNAIASLFFREYGILQRRVRGNFGDNFEKKEMIVDG